MNTEEPLIRTVFQNTYPEGITKGLFKLSHVNTGISLYEKLITVRTISDDWYDFVERELVDWVNQPESADAGVLLSPDGHVLIEYFINNKILSAYVLGSRENIAAVKGQIESNFESVVSSIKWIYDEKGSSLDVNLNTDRAPLDVMYPFLNGETLESYYDRFLRDSASIILLIGPPGVGKTSWIRGLLHYAKTAATVTYDQNILKADAIFANFIGSSTSDILVLEDSDVLLSSRGDGNGLMQKFLNVGDGLISAKHKKIIFSTNLPSIKDVDEALIRPGRCFDILKFGKLTKDQALKVAEAVGVTLPEDQNSYTLAEVFHKGIKNTSTPARFI